MYGFPVMVLVCSLQFAVLIAIEKRRVIVLEKRDWHHREFRVTITVCLLVLVKR